MAVNFDLLGDPIPEGRGKAGRTGHVATKENASKIRVLLLAGMSVGDIAKHLGISAPTLRKHYFHSGKVNARLAQKMALSETRARNMIRLQEQADKGNVSAIKEMNRITDKIERDIIEREMADDPKQESLGVKGQRALDAHSAEDDLSAELDNEAKRGFRPH